MAIPLKESTASQEVVFGIFVDETDGKTAETGLTIANTDIKIWKAGATTLADKNSGGATHISGGIYYAVFDATDTNTVGAGTAFVHVAGALPCKLEFVVHPANVYDSLYGTDKLDVNVAQISEDTTAADNLESYTDGTTPMPVNAIQISGDATSADNLELATDGTGFGFTNCTIPTVTTATNVTTVNGLAANVITSSALATSAVDEIVDATWDEARSGHTTAGTFGSAAQIVDEGTLAAVGSTTSVTLAASAPAENDVLNGAVITFRSATTGALQSRYISGYTSLKVATLSPALSPALTGTVLYQIFPAPISATDASVAAAVWDLARSGHATSGTFGEYIDAAISSRSTVTTAQVNTECDTALADVGATSANFTKIAGLPSATAGTNGGVFIAGTNAATSITTALTANIVGNITGALSGAVGSVTGNVGGNVTGSVGSLAAQAKADVNTEADTALSDYGALKPTTAGRTLDVTATGAAGIDLANVENEGTTLALSGTTIAAVSGAVGSVTGAVGSVTGNVGGNVTGTVASVVGNVGGNVVGTVASVVGAVGSVTGAVASVTAGVTVATGGIVAGSIAADAITAAKVADDVGEQFADQLIGRNINGGSNTGRVVKQALHALRNKVVIDGSGLTISVKDTDDSAESWAGTITLAARSPIASIDPA